MERRQGRGAPGGRAGRRAAEAIGRYRDAVSVWGNPPRGPSRGVLLVRALADRGRARQVWSGVPDRSGGDALAQVWQEAELALAEQVLGDSAVLDALLRGEVMAQADGLSDGLDRVVRTAEDAVVRGDPEWGGADLRRAAETFLVALHDLTRTAEELEDLGWGRQVGTEALRASLRRVGVRLRAGFWCFTPVRSLLTACRKAEGDPDWWWLRERPKAGAAEAPIPDGLFDHLVGVYRQSAQADLEPCGWEEETIAFAHGELSGSAEQGVRKHLATCRACSDLRQLLEDADRETKATPDWARAREPIRLDPTTYEAFREHLAQVAPHLELADFGSLGREGSLEVVVPLAGARLRAAAASDRGAWLTAEAARGVGTSSKHRRRALGKVARLQGGQVAEVRVFEADVTHQRARGGEFVVDGRVRPQDLAAILGAYWRAFWVLPEGEVVEALSFSLDEKGYFDAHFPFADEPGGALSLLAQTSVAGGPAGAE